MKRILFLMQLPPPVHGASVVNKSIQESQLINNEFETYYIDISPAEDMDDLGKFSFYKLKITFFIIFRAVVAKIKFKPDLVYMTLSPHGIAFYKDGILALLIKALGSRLVFHMHGKGVNKAAKCSFFKKRFYRAVFKQVDVIHLSEDLFYDLDGIRDVTRTIVDVPNGVAPLDFSGQIITTKKVTFIYLSNLVRSKGADILIRASALVPEELREKFNVKIVGRPSDNNYLAELNEIIVKNGCGNIEILGPKYGYEKIAELYSADVFVLPTHFKNECFPLAILEAMSCGLAVISTREGAIPTIVENGITGDILVDCTPEALALAMVKYIVNPEYLKACAEAGKGKFYGHYTQSVFERRLATTLNAFLEVPET